KTTAAITPKIEFRITPLLTVGSAPLGHRLLMKKRKEKRKKKHATYAKAPASTKPFPHHVLA
ncbi:MAG: hypothetical protein RJS98_04240, partial [Rhodospirillaceae bacterium]